jgi:hypothetical protein
VIFEFDDIFALLDWVGSEKRSGRSVCMGEYEKMLCVGFLKLISKTHFRPGGMRASELTRSVRAVSDTPVADYSAPGVNTTRRVVYRPPMAVSVHACIRIAMQWVTLRKSLLMFLLH